MVLAWGVAFGLVSAVMVGAWGAAERQLAHRFDGLSTVFLGTSLVRHAVPNANDGLAAHLFRTGPFLRVGLSGASETQLLRLSQAALTAKVDALFIEVNPLVTRFSGDVVGCGPTYRLKTFARFLRDASQTALVGRDLLRNAVLDPPAQGAGMAFDRAFAPNYPLVFPPLCHPTDWKRLVAQAGDTQIVLVAMPRSERARAAIGPADMARFQQAAEMLAAQLGLPLFAPDLTGSWPDDHFKDQAHMNARGSQRFLAALDQWMANRR